jgi:hypothetical protein
MKKAVIVLIIVAAEAAGWYLFVYEKPGPVEQLGRDIDEGIEKIRYGDETAAEKAGRKTKEAVDDVKKELEK